MTKTNEYLERRCVINEAVLHDLGVLIAAHLPAIQSQLSQMGVDWKRALDRLDREMPDIDSTQKEN